MARPKAPFVTGDGDSAPTPGEGASFAGLFDRFWDSLIDDGATACQADRIEQHLALRPGARIVVAPSGCGRLALALAARGHDVVGIDRSSDAIERAQALAAQAGLDVTFIHCEALSLNAAGACDGAICLRHGLPLTLLAAHLAAVLKPGASALVDVDGGGGLSAVSTVPAVPGLEIMGHVGSLDGVSPGRLLLVRRR
jgi:hypothetical protein